MSRRLATLVYDRKVGSVHRKAILAYFADRASDNGKGVWASKQTIADETECGRSTVIKIIAEFVSEGLVTVAGERPCQNGKTIVYDLNVDAILALPATRNPSTSGTSPDQDPSTSGTPPVHQRDPKGSTSGTQTVLEPSLNQREAIASPKKRARALPENWVPSDANVAHALSKNFTHEEIEDEANKFRDHHLAKGTTFKDWDAGWRTWIGKAREFRNRRMAGGQIPGGYGQGGGIAGAVARRQFGGEV